MSLIKKELSKIFAIISIWNIIVTIKCVYIYTHINEFVMGFKFKLYKISSRLKKYFYTIT